MEKGWWWWVGGGWGGGAGLPPFQSVDDESILACRLKWKLTHRQSHKFAGKATNSWSKSVIGELVRDRMKRQREGGDFHDVPRLDSEIDVIRFFRPYKVRTETGNIELI